MDSADFTLAEMQTLFLPLAPNPVTGGFLVSLPGDRVLDVGLSVEGGRPLESHDRLTPLRAGT